MGKVIENAVLFAMDCVNDCRYEEALTIFSMVMDNPILASDETSGEFFELDLVELVEEEIVRINLRVLALHVLYSEYQFQPIDNRAESLYSYYAYPYFREIHIEDMFVIGREELDNLDLFFRSWTDMLMKQNGDVAARLLKDGILYDKGIMGLVDVARKSYDVHPSIYLEALLEFERIHDYEKMKEIGKEALEVLAVDLKIRGDIAIKVAQASHCVGDLDYMGKCWYEAFNSNSTVSNYLRLYVDGDVAKRYKSLAVNKINSLSVVDNQLGHLSESERAQNNVTGSQYKFLKFFSGCFEEVKDWCMEQKQPLGWSGGFIGDGIDLLLLYLYADHELKEASLEIATRVSSSIGLNVNKNLVFIKKNAIFENDVHMPIDHSAFWDVFTSWRSHFVMANGERKAFVEWLEAVIDQRITGIVEGQFRRKYRDVAMLAATLGEVKESLGIKGAKEMIINI